MCTTLTQKIQVGTDMDNFTLMLLGAGLTGGGVIALRGSNVTGVRALAAAAVAPGAIMLFATVVNAVSGSAF